MLYAQTACFKELCQLLTDSWLFNSIQHSMFECTAAAAVCFPLRLQESFHTRNAITYIKTHEAVAKLRENLRAEHNVTIEFCAAVFKGVSHCAVHLQQAMSRQFQCHS